MSHRGAGLFLAILTTLLVGCDHVTKIAAHGLLAGRGAVELLPGFLDLRYAENDDTAFSLLRGVAMPGKAAILGVVSILVLGVLLGFLWRRSRGASTSELIAIALVAAGALGNVIDRVGRGYVVDFIHVHHWPIFNVADALLLAGAVLLALHGRRRDLRGSTHAT